MRPMDNVMIETYLENLDRRLTRVEQILPTLATKEDLKSLAPKEDLKSLATKEDMKSLATKEEMRDGLERLRLDMTILIEARGSKIELIAEHVLELLQWKRSNE
jgi:hypothetical protein